MASVSSVAAWDREKACFANSVSISLQKETFHLSPVCTMSCASLLTYSSSCSPYHSVLGLGAGVGGGGPQIVSSRSPRSTQADASRPRSSSSCSSALVGSDSASDRGGACCGGGAQTREFILLAHLG